MSPALLRARVISSSAPTCRSRSGGRTAAWVSTPRALRPQLERDGAFHVRAAVVDGLGHREQPVVDGTRGGVVLGLAGRDQLDQRLGGEPAVADQGAVDVEHGVQQVLVVAGEDLQVGVLGAQDGDLGVPAAHVPHAVLGREHPGLGGDLQLGVQAVGGLGGVGVLEQDQRQPGLLVHDAVALLRGAVLVAEAQPAVGGVEQACRCAGVDGALGLQPGDLVTLAGDAGDDRHPVGGLDHGADDGDLLLGGQVGALAGMAQADQALDAVDGGQPPGQGGDRCVVDLEVGGERGDRCGDEATKIESHEVSLSARRWERSWYRSRERSQA